MGNAAVTLGLTPTSGRMTDPNRGSSTMARRKRDDKTKDLFAYAEDNHTPTIVYIATSRTTGKKYIGITRKSLAQRRRGHISTANSKPGAMRFARAIRKYGIDDFEFVVSSTWETFKEGCREEQRLIAVMKPAYNVAMGGNGPIGVRRSAKTRAQMSKTRKGRPSPNKGITFSEERIEAIRQRFTAKHPMYRYWLGKKRSPSTLEKISATRRRRRETIGSTEKELAWQKAQRKWVLCLNDGKMYHGTLAAGNAYGIHKTSVRDVCRGKSKATRGHKFRYVEGPK